MIISNTLLVMSHICKFKNGSTSSLYCSLHGSLLDLERIDVWLQFKSCELILIFALLFMLFGVVGFTTPTRYWLDNLAGQKFSHFDI